MYAARHFPGELVGADGHIVVLVARLRSADAADAWREFLEMYAGIILAAIRFSESDPDSAGDAFVYVCEQLRRDRFRRLRRFQAGGRASFRTWLCAVVRNLHSDWRRRQFGRRRPLKIVERMSSLDAEVFRLRFELGVPEEQAVQALLPRFPGTDGAAVNAAEERIRHLVSDRQHGHLEQRARRSAMAAPIALEGLLEKECAPRAGDADPEQSAAAAELRTALASAIRRLEPSERYLLQMRFGQELTLQEIARLAGLKDAQTADRRLRDVLGKLQRFIEPGGGKVPAQSV